ncbi:MAG: DUF6314 family protein [Rhodothermales bacterium]
MIYSPEMHASHDEPGPDFWRHLLAARASRVETRTGDVGLCIGEAVIRVEAMASPCAVETIERGVWTSGPLAGIAFSTAYRWVWDAGSGHLHLSHLRFGADRPLFLVTLVRRKTNDWRTVAPHRCGADVYEAAITSSPAGFSLRWRVQGPVKDQQLTTRYRSG